MWLLEQNAFNQWAMVLRSTHNITAEQQMSFSANRGNIITVTGDTARINVKGILTQAPNIFAAFFGGGNTTYADIQKAIAAAESDKNVKKTEMFFDTPGGNVDGLFETIATMQAATKPIRTVCDGLCASAGYALASQGDTFVSTSEANRIGSIGVVADIPVDENVVSITSTEAPKKRPDVTTEEGRAVVREELDDVHELFAEAIATGRNTSVKNVNKNFGRGATMTARRALENGMIDKVDTPVTTSAISPTQATVTGDNLKPKEVKTTMDLETLRTEHPKLYAQVVKLGAESERDRVTALLELGSASGDMDRALTAISEGKPLDANLNAKFLAASMRNQEVSDRGGDNQEIDAAAEGADTSVENADDLAEKAQQTKLTEQVFNACGAKFEQTAEA